MRRVVGTILPAVLLVAFAGAGAAAAYAPPAIPSAFVARFDQNRFLAGSGTATSRVDLLAVGGQVTTRLLGRPPGERWQILIYDVGTCSNVRHVVLRLPILVIGSEGGRTESVELTATSRQAIIRALRDRARLAVRLSSGSYHTCQRYYPVQLR